MIDIVSKQDCVGCKACGDICPVNAITYEVDQEGFWYPYIDNKMCIGCGLCEKTCPALQRYTSSLKNRTEPKAYKVYHKDDSIRYNSTSGGLYYALAKAFLEEGGYIAGCVYNDDYSGAHHTISNTVDGLNKIMRSKYFQSDTEGIFQEVKTLLDAGEKVLFCGAPCQISALYGFLRKEYPFLYSVDFICRGINSPLAFTKYMEELKGKFQSEIEEVHFKNKSHGWTNLGTLVRFKNGKKYYRSKLNDPWVNAFVAGGLYLRPSCAVCKYKGFPRVSDISMGDFWGLTFTKEEEKLGVSVALSNTEKGDKLLMLARKFLYMEERQLEEAVKGNPALIDSVTLNPAREEFFRRIKKESYSKAVWRVLGISKGRRGCRILKAWVVGTVRRILGKR